MLAEAIDDISPAVRANAACNDLQGSLTGVFFSEELQDIAAAKRLCAECPVLAECLEGAMARREPWGVWGGQLFLNGNLQLASSDEYRYHEALVHPAMASSDAHARTLFRPSRTTASRTESTCLGRLKYAELTNRSSR